MGFANIGFPSLILLFIIALLLFGPRKLPEIGRAFGQTLAEFKKTTNELMSMQEEEVTNNKEDEQ